jgi:hypothetical protein
MEHFGFNQSQRESNQGETENLNRVGEEGLSCSRKASTSCICDVKTQVTDFKTLVEARMGRIAVTKPEQAAPDFGSRQVPQLLD